MGRWIFGWGNSDPPTTLVQIPPRIVGKPLAIQQDLSQIKALMHDYEQKIREHRKLYEKAAQELDGKILEIKHANLMEDFNQRSEYLDRFTKARVYAEWLIGEIEIYEGIWNQLNAKIPPGAG